jgi:hypothetical protein
VTAENEAKKNKLIDIHIDNYRFSLAWAQKSFLISMALAAIIKAVPYTENEGGKALNLPFVKSLKFESISSFEIALLVLYLAAGVSSWVYMRAAQKNIKEIKGADIRIAVSNYPCLLVSNIWLQALIFTVLFGTAYSLSPNIIEFSESSESIYKMIFSFFLVFPFFASLSIGGDIFSLSERSKNEEIVRPWKLARSRD